MKRLAIQTICALLLSLFTACQWLTTPKEESRIRVFMGYVTFGHEVRAFRQCGDEAAESFWAIDVSQRLWNLHKEMAPHHAPYEEVFAVVEGRLTPPQEGGFGVDYPGTLIVREVLYAGVEGMQCTPEWAEFGYRASGNEPFWRIIRSPDGLRLTRLDYPDRSWTEVHVQRDSDSIKFLGQSDAQTSATLTLTRAPCRDSMSGAYSNFTARLELDGETLVGCGVKGSASSIFDSGGVR